MIFSFFPPRVMHAQQMAKKEMSQKKEVSNFGNITFCYIIYAVASIYFFLCQENIHAKLQMSSYFTITQRSYILGSLAKKRVEKQPNNKSYAEATANYPQMGINTEIKRHQRARKGQDAGGFCQ